MKNLLGIGLMGILILVVVGCTSTPSNVNIASDVSTSGVSTAVVKSGLISEIEEIPLSEIEKIRSLIKKQQQIASDKKLREKAEVILAHFGNWKQYASGPLEIDFKSGPAMSLSVNDVETQREGLIEEVFIKYDGKIVFYSRSKTMHISDEPQVHIGCYIQDDGGWEKTFEEVYSKAIQEREDFDKKNMIENLKKNFGIEYTDPQRVQ
jgi:hypothetical protein